jgi:hypothetical protein
MKIQVKETDGLGNATVPAGYNQPNFGLGTATPAGPGPDQHLIAQSAAATPNGIDPVNRGFSIGGADDSLAEFEKNQDNPGGLGIGGGTPTPPMNSPSHPDMASMKEDGFGANPDGSPIGEGESPFGEGENPFTKEEGQTFENVDALPAFEDIAEDPALAALPVDANGIIDPIVVPEDIIVEPELGAIPDVALPLEEPIVGIDEDDVDIQIPENVFENDGLPESIPVQESFKLPENQSVIITKGDQIFLLGHVREEFTPKFAESAFTRALKSLCESKGGGRVVMTGDKKEKVAIVGRSMLVEIAKDWRLPGTNTIFEAHDLLQIVSAKPVKEAEETDDDKDTKGKEKKEDDAKAKAEEEADKAKKEYYLAKRRWFEAKKKKGEADDDDDDDDDDDPDKKAEKDKAKKEAAWLASQRNRGLI